MPNMTVRTETIHVAEVAGEAAPALAGADHGQGPGGDPGPEVAGTGRGRATGPSRGQSHVRGTGPCQSRGRLTGVVVVLAGQTGRTTTTEQAAPEIDGGEIWRYRNFFFYIYIYIYAI